jgi:hypothetical protein
MSQVATSGPETRTVPAPKPSAPMKDIDTLLKRAGEGDRGCISEVRALLADPDDGPDYRKGFGSSAEWLRQSIIRKSAGKDLERGTNRPDVGGGSPGRVGGKAVHEISWRMIRQINKFRCMI